MTGFEVVLDRAKGKCEARLSECQRTATQIHHIKLRSRGGSDEPINLMVVCLICHKNITENKPGTHRFRGHSWNVEGTDENGDKIVLADWK